MSQYAKKGISNTYAHDVLYLMLGTKLIYDHIFTRDEHDMDVDMEILNLK